MKPSTKRSLSIIGVVLAVTALISGGGLWYRWYEKNLPAYEPPETREALPAITDRVRLAALGDWGSGDRNQWRVIKAMDDVAGELGGFHAGLLLGDNFYPKGVASVDDPLWKRLFEEPFDTRRLGGLSWYAVLGNHDYGGNVEAQIDYTARSGGRWNMPAHSYRKDFGPADGEALLTVLALDSDPRFPEAEWQQQLRWLEEQLRELEHAPQFVVAMAHEPVVSYSKHGASKHMDEQVRPLLEHYGVSLYLCGHDHSLQLIERGGVAYVVAGGGGKTLYDVHDGEGQVFGAKAFGFVVIEADANKIAVDFYDSGKTRLFHWSGAKKHLAAAASKPER